MGGRKRGATHWAAKKKQAKKAKAENAQNNDNVKTDTDHRRAGFIESIHPGSYAALLPPIQEDEIDVSTADKVKLETKRRYGLWIAFCGKNYSGMQMNEGVKTIEAELERALYTAGGIARSNYGYLQKVGWSRAARTDKGVHAAGQLITLKLHVGDDIPSFQAKVNEHLPPDIQVMHMVTVTKNFNAKNSCDRRTYEYLMPTFLFIPKDSNEFNDDIRKIWSRNQDIPPANLSIYEKYRKFRLPSEALEKLKATLKEYEGSHNFHNFTSKLPPSSDQARRYIVSFTVVNEPFMHSDTDLEWIRLRVVGQSFLLHQIRKMIGLAIEIVRTFCSQVPDNVHKLITIEQTMTMKKVDIPKAPSLGLYLAQAHFVTYNRKLESSVSAQHPPLELTDTNLVERIETFKKNYIWQHIWDQESKDHSFGLWLHTLKSLPFDYIERSYDEWKVEKEEEAIRDKRSGRETQEQVQNQK